MPLGPFDLNGGQFLALYCLLLAGAIAAGFYLPRWLRPLGRNQSIVDTDHLAYLSGGGGRVVDAVVARLLARGALTQTDKEFVPEPGTHGQNAAEQAVLALPAPIRWSTIGPTLTSHVTAVKRGLIEGGLLMTNGSVWTRRLLLAAPYLLLFAFGAIKWQIGQARDRPVGFLTALLIVTAILALHRLFSYNRLTQAGIAAINRAKEQADRLRRAPTTPEIGLAVALFGTAVLVGSGWDAFHALRSSSSSSSDGGGGGDGGGDGGGCGGGGCGGCGGCGG